MKLLLKVEWRFATELNRLVYKDAYSLIETEAVSKWYDNMY